jgi:hypothetical protein
MYHTHGTPRDAHPARVLRRSPCLPVLQGKSVSTASLLQNLVRNTNINLAGIGVTLIGLQASGAREGGCAGAGCGAQAVMSVPPLRRAPRPSPAARRARHLLRACVPVQSARW